MKTLKEKLQERQSFLIQERNYLDQEITKLGDRRLLLDLKTMLDEK